MSAPPAIRPVPERAFQTAVIELAERLRYRVAHFHDSRREVRPRVFVGDKRAAGWPDLVMTRANRLILAELKSEKGRVRPEQQEWLHALRNTTAGLTGLLEVYIWRPSQMDEIAAILGKWSTT